MSDPSILGQIALGYSPFIDRNRAVTATRLTVMPLRPDAVLDVAQLLHEVGNVWPASGGRVSLNVVSESLLQDLLLLLMLLLFFFLSSLSKLLQNL